MQDLSEPEGEPLRIKLDGSFNNTTTYSIRSPMSYQARSEESTIEDEGAEPESTSEEDMTSDEEDQGRERVSKVLNAANDWNLLN